MKRLIKFLVPATFMGVALLFSSFLREESNSRPGTSLSAKILHPSPEPDRVILNLTATPETSIAVNWRTDTTVHTGIVEVAEAAAGPEFQEQSRRITAEKEFLRVRHLEEPEVFAHYFSATLDELAAGKKYVYRVGNGTTWSEWYQFRMPDPEKKLSFLYFGDAQTAIKSMWSRVIREAYRTLPDADFMLHAGDLINRHDRDIEWGEWFYAGNYIHATVPSVMAPGNHEYSRTVDLSPQWRRQFNLPLNGPKGLEETCYVADYTYLKVVSLNSEEMDESPHFLERQAVWLDSLLTHNPRKWTVITFHHPVFSTKSNRDNLKLRARFKPIFDKHGIDLVLQGHDHAYGRGMVNNVETGYEIDDKTSGTMYVVSVAGPKMYDVSDDGWMDRRARATQLFQTISIEGDVLTYRAYTADGELYDGFDLQKRKGKPNKLVNRIPATPERL